MFLSIAAGFLLLRLMSYPDTQIEIGIGSVRHEGTECRAVPIDFDTPTTDQMIGHAGLEVFDRWAVHHAGTVIDGTGSLPLLRIPSLRAAPADTILRYTVQFSGFLRMKDRMIPPQLGYIPGTWGVVMLPYAAVGLARLLRRMIRRKK